MTVRRGGVVAVIPFRRTVPVYRRGHCPTAIPDRQEDPASC